MPEALTQAPSKKSPAKATVAKKAAAPAKKPAAKPAEAKPVKKAAPAVAKAPAKKPAAAKAAAPKSAAPKPAKVAAKVKPAAQGNGETVITPEQRYRMICDAAYFRAERRGFVGGNSVEDWLAAEAEIDDLLRSMQQ